jgi:surface protein
LPHSLTAFGHAHNIVPKAVGFGYDIALSSLQFRVIRFVPSEYAQPLEWSLCCLLGQQGMFQNAALFTSNLSGWDVAATTRMDVRTPNISQGFEFAHELCTDPRYRNTTALQP